MEDAPLFIQWYAEKLGKDVTAFTLDDWRSLAFAAAAEVQALNRELAIAEQKLPPPPGKPGRPRKHPKYTRNYLYHLLHPEYRYKEPKRRRRHITDYYGMPIAWYDYALEELRKCSDAPRIETKLLKLLLSWMREDLGSGVDVDQRSLERALRRFRADTKKQKSP